MLYYGKGEEGGDAIMVIDCPKCKQTRCAGELENVAAFFANGYESRRSRAIDVMLQRCPCGNLVLISPTCISWARDPTEAMNAIMDRKKAVAQ